MADQINTTIKEIKRAAKRKGISFHVQRNGGNHVIWSLDGLPIPIPNSRIHHRTVHLIRRECEPKLGQRWWLGPAAVKPNQAL